MIEHWAVNTCANLNMQRPRQAVMISAQWCLQYIISKQDWSLSVTFTFNVYLLLAKHFNCSSGFPVFDVACFLPNRTAAAAAIAVGCYCLFACGRSRRFNYSSIRLLVALQFSCVNICVSKLVSFPLFQNQILSKK